MQVKDFKNKYFKTSALPDCSGCGKNNYLRLQNRFRCRSCLREYSLFKGTVLEKNHLPLEKWLKVIQRYSERTIAARALANLEGIRYPTALRMLKTFRFSNLQWQDEQALEGEIEIVNGENHKKRIYKTNVSSFDWTIISQKPYWILNSNMPIVRNKPEILLYNEKNEKISSSNYKVFAKYHGILYHDIHAFLPLYYLLGLSLLQFPYLTFTPPNQPYSFASFSMCLD